MFSFSILSDFSKIKVLAPLVVFVLLTTFATTTYSLVICYVVRDILT